MFGCLSRRGFRLGMEAGDIVGIGETARQDHLQGDDAVERRLPGAIDDPHAAAGDLAEQLVFAEALA